jgi:hypothetical protein
VTSADHAWLPDPAQPARITDTAITDTAITDTAITDTAERSQPCTSVWERSSSS